MPSRVDPCVKSPLENPYYSWEMQSGNPPKLVPTIRNRAMVCLAKYVTLYAATSKLAYYGAFALSHRYFTKFDPERGYTFPSSLQIALSLTVAITASIFSLSCKPIDRVDTALTPYLRKDLVKQLTLVALTAIALIELRKYSYSLLELPQQCFITWILTMIVPLLIAPALSLCKEIYSRQSLVHEAERYIQTFLHLRHWMWKKDWIHFLDQEQTIHAALKTLMKQSLKASKQNDSEEKQLLRSTQNPAKKSFKKKVFGLFERRLDKTRQPACSLNDYLRSAKKHEERRSIETYLRKRTFEYIFLLGILAIKKNALSKKDVRKVNIIGEELCLPAVSDKSIRKTFQTTDDVNGWIDEVFITITLTHTMEIGPLLEYLEILPNRFTKAKTIEKCLLFCTLNYTINPSREIDLDVEKIALYKKLFMIFQSKELVTSIEDSSDPRFLEKFWMMTFHRILSLQEQIKTREKTITLSANLVDFTQTLNKILRPKNRSINLKKIKQISRKLPPAIKEVCAKWIEDNFSSNSEKKQRLKPQKRKSAL
ncbi:MAG: hypothetical protein AAGI90_05325 [Chlamydiota bacterium]